MLQRLAVAGICAVSWTASASVSELPNTTGSIEIDGTLDEAAWHQSLRVELRYENNPGENSVAPVETVAYLAEDGRNLYIAFVASDPDPDRIRAWLRDRDSLDSNDFVGISLDTYNDGRRAFEFFANPLGVQLDKTNDDVSKQNDAAWDAIWESAGRIGDDGYVVEMRIPLSQLRYQDVDGEQTWGYRLIRKYPRERDVSISNMAKDRGRNCKVCQYPKLRGFSNLAPSRNIEFVPTVTASQSESTPSPGAVALERGDLRTDVGVTARFGLTPEMTANLAVNPDFSQIEADGVQLDINNRFALSYPEKRPFFLEGADFFRTPVQAVFTRSVVNPEFAAKLTGKRGANTIASYAARDRETSLLFPGASGSETASVDAPNTVFVGRYSRGLFDTSAVGGLLTIRDGDGYRNTVGGVDLRWRIDDRHEFTAQALRSQTEYPMAIAVEYDQPAGRFDGHAVLLRHAFETRDWFAKLDHWQFDRGFRADAGFVNQAGSGQTEYSLGRKWYGEDRWWTRLRLRGAYEIKERQDGQLLEDTYILQFTVNGRWQSSFDVNMRTGREFNEGRLYDVERVNVTTRVEPFGGLVFGIATKFGDEIDVDNARLAQQKRFQPFVDWNLSRHLLLRLNGTKVALETLKGEPIFDASVVDARLTWQFDRRSFLRLTVQQKDVERNADLYIDVVETRTIDLGRQLLYAWKLNPQTVFFLGYSDSYVDDDDLPRRTVADRSWFMKVGYAWAL